MHLRLALGSRATSPPDRAVYPTPWDGCASLLSSRDLTRGHTVASTSTRLTTWHALCSCPARHPRARAACPPASSSSVFAHVMEQKPPLRRSVLRTLRPQARSCRCGTRIDRQRAVASGVAARVAVAGVRAPRGVAPGDGRACRSSLLQSARARTVEDLEHAQIDPDVRAERRRRLAEPPLAFPAHGRSMRQHRHRCMSSRRNAGAAVRPTRTRSTAASTRRRTQLATRRGSRRERRTRRRLSHAESLMASVSDISVHQSERLTAVFCSVTTRTLLLEARTSFSVWAA